VASDLSTPNPSPSLTAALPTAIAESFLDPAMYHEIFHNIDAGFCVIDMVFDGEKAVDYVIRTINGAFERYTGLSANAVNVSIRGLLPEHEQEWFDRYGLVARTGNRIHFEMQSKALKRWYSVDAFRVGLPEQGRVAVLFMDITERKRFERELHEFASMDALTQLSNRRVFMDYLETEQARVQRRDLSTSSLLMCDLDHFKLVNDRWGHGVGDRALRHFSNILRSQLRASDLAGRIGGEEFAVLLSGAGSFPARDFACRVQHALANQPLRVDSEAIHLTLSIGITQLSPQDATPDNALSRADKALYRAKQNGRNRVEIN